MKKNYENDSTLTPKGVNLTLSCFSGSVFLKEIDKFSQISNFFYWQLTWLWFAVKSPAGV